jgi:probable F420-dependent oxidoreductase
MPNTLFVDWETGYAGADLTEVAVLAEELGFDAISCADHPFPSDASIAEGGFQDFDPFVTLSFFAQATTRIRLLTSVLVAGHRNPYMTAKSVASLDLFSAGRFTLGIAAGYRRAEIEALGGSWADRGRRLDEQLDVMEKAWTGQPVFHDGPAFPALGHTMLPRPRQRPRPPIWIGGHSDAALRRAARFEGWMPDRFAPTAGDQSFERFGRRIALAQELHAEISPGRPPLEIWSTPRWRPDGRSIDWTPARVAADVPRFAEIGVGWMRVGTLARSLPELLDNVREYGERLPLGGSRSKDLSR